MDYRRIISGELHRRKIKKIKWSNSDSGTAIYYDRSVEIPYPKNQFKLGVCFHEIGHIVHKHTFGKLRYIEEYEAELFAIEQLKKRGIYHRGYIIEAKLDVMRWIISAIKRGHDINKVPKEIIGWCKINKQQWVAANSITIPFYQKPKSIKKAFIIFL